MVSCNNGLLCKVSKVFVIISCPAKFLFRIKVGIQRALLSYARAN